jgi:hypothetical protein
MKTSDLIVLGLQHFFFLCNILNVVGGGSKHHFASLVESVTVVGRDLVRSHVHSDHSHRKRDGSDVCALRSGFSAGQIGPSYSVL